MSARVLLYVNKKIQRYSYNFVLRFSYDRNRSFIYDCPLPNGMVTVNVLFDLSIKF